MKRTLFIFATLCLTLSSVFGEDFFHGQKVGGEILCGCSGQILKFDTNGDVVWKFSEGVGNMGDTQLLENGNILFADADSVTEITQKGEIVFQFRAEDERPDATFTAQRLADGSTLVGWNTRNCLILLDSTGKIQKTIPCQFADAPNSHHNMRMARKTSQNTYLVAHKRAGVVAEYAEDGTVLRKMSIPGKECYGVLELPDGQVLASFLDTLYIFDRDGQIVWSFSKSEMPEIPISYMCSLQVRANGNIVVGNYAANRGDAHDVCMFEITRDKKLVWYYQNPNAPASFMNVRVLETPACATASDWFEVRGGLSNCREVFEKTKKGTVAFVGGSITEMNGWRNLVIEEIQRRFPDTEFEFISAGISSTGSTPGAFRLTTDVFTEGRKIDLLFEEAAVNDYTNFRTQTEMLRGMEGIVRHARILNPNIDVVVMYFAEPAKCQDYRNGKTPEVIVQHERVAEHYNVPSINLAKEVTDRIDAGEFTWEKDFRDLHPAPFGHQLYCRTISRLFDVAWGANAPAPGTPALPAPLDEHSYSNGHYEKIDGAKLGTGWTYVENWAPSKFKVGTRHGFVSVPMLETVTPGAELSFPFTGTGIGVFAISGPDTGILEYSVDGAAWKSKDFYTPWSSMLYLPWSQVLESELPPGTHELRLRLSSETNERSAGPAFRIVHFLVN